MQDLKLKKHNLNINSYDLSERTNDSKSPKSTHRAILDEVHTRMTNDNKAKQNMIGDRLSSLQNSQKNPFSNKTKAIRRGYENEIANSIYKDEGSYATQRNSANKDTALNAYIKAQS